MPQEDKKSEESPEVRANLFVIEYDKLCRKYRMIHRSIPFKTEGATVQADLQVVQLAN